MSNETLMINKTTTIETPIANNDPSQSNAPSQEYINEMTAKADQGLDVSGTQAPKLLAGKYKDQEALNKGILEALTVVHDGSLENAYTSIVKGIGGKSEGKPPEQTVENGGESGKAQPPESGTALPDGEGNKTPLEPVNEGSQNTGELDLSKYFDEYAQKGAISKESYTELEAVGYKKEDVNQYISDTALTYAQTQAIINLAGGVDQYQKIVAWGEGNLTPEQVVAYDKTMNSGNLDAMTAQFNEVAKGFNANTSMPPQNRVSPQDGDIGLTGLQGYTSRAQMTRDMDTDEYKTDPAFRKEVMEKIRLSKIM